jgi:hypothetical protein
MVVCWWENETTQDDGQAIRSLGAKTSSREQGLDFDLVWTLWMVVVRETPGGHVYDVLVMFFPSRVYTDSNYRDTLGYEWLLVHCYHLVVCLVVLMAWIRGC